ncbi:hypothetical protein [Paraferrimonas sedimenticola]|uniref:YbgF trimerisation domain-containing protein n=1 Tax=Paraferrimonas sedimenticola TaxID=375674 RepID=A0AA37RUQ0_9GAMM|nr:hypothetical protein [Paraferrimonas sedimenticola]GLP94942.1 hypothetical protein GCM10007895_02480 [Paraferrimonas sedimenticola]
MRFLLILIVTLLCVSPGAQSIVPNDGYYRIADSRIDYLENQLKDVDAQLALTPEQSQLNTIRESLVKEIELIQARVKLYKELEGLGIIKYLSNDDG